jgi:SAM-dependent methyltransferase
MRHSRMVLVFLLTALVGFGCDRGGAQEVIGAQDPAPSPVQVAPPAPAPARPEVPYVPTPPEVVDAMLKMAKVTKDDVVYDLGSGDGRIVIAAAKQYGARGIGVDIDPKRVEEARANAKRAGVADRATFKEQDLFDTDLREATVVTMYLLPQVNLRLRPKLFRELKPGTRVVSHSFDMGGWKPLQTETINGKTIYYWEIPANAEAMNVEP